MRYFLSVLFLLSSCSLFDTRNPEEPDSGKVSFPPATSPNVLIDNFTNSIIEKRIDNYMDCFADGETSGFLFSPSQDAFSSYPSFFDNWNYAVERRYFLALLSNFSGDEKFSLDLTAKNTNFVSPDSTLFDAQYVFSLPTLSQSAASIYAGKIQLTLVPLSDGTWRILRWIDSPQARTDTTFQTWSFLKAAYYN